MFAFRGIYEKNTNNKKMCIRDRVTEGSKQDVYYLLNDKKLDNGFYIASTVLNEAIDPQILRTHPVSYTHLDQCG